MPHLGSAGRTADRNLERNLPLARAAVAAAMDRKVVLKDLAKPGEQLVPRTTVERAEVAVCAQERVLHEVRGPSLGDQVGIEPARGDQQQIFATRLESATQDFWIAGACFSQQQGNRIITNRGVRHEVDIELRMVTVNVRSRAARHPWLSRSLQPLESLPYADGCCKAQVDRILRVFSPCKIF